MLSLLWLVCIISQQNERSTSLCVLFHSKASVLRLYVYYSTAKRAFWVFMWIISWQSERSVSLCVLFHSKASVPHLYVFYFTTKWAFYVFMCINFTEKRAFYVFMCTISQQSERSTSLCVLFNSKASVPHLYVFYFTAKRAFYVYVLILALLDATQAVGSTLLYSDVLNGMWYVNNAMYL